MLKRYWTNTEPEGFPKTLFIKVLTDKKDGPRDMSFTRFEQMRDWLKTSNWTKDEPQTITVSVGGWHSLQAHNLLCNDDNVVTIESIADHMTNRFHNWSRVQKEIAPYLQFLANEGYTIGFIQMDIEGCTMTRNWKYDGTYHGAEVIHMKDVIEYMYSVPKMAKKLPHVNVDVLLQQNIYGVRKNEQTMMTWNHWAMWRNSQAWDKYIAEMAKQVFPDVIVNNYGFNNYWHSPLITWPHGHPQVDAGVDNNSAPILYLSNDTTYKTNEEALIAFDTIRNNGKICPWVGAAHRNTGGWNQTQAQFDELNAELESRGCPLVMIF